VVHAAVSGSWGPRLPAIKEAIGLTQGQLGIALTGLAVGLFAGTRLAGRPIRHWGSRRVIRVGTLVLCATLVGPAIAGSLLWVTLSLFVLGAASGLLDVAINTNAVALERGFARPIMSSIHGTWSAGLLAGAGIAAGAAALSISPLVHFGVVAVALSAASALSLRDLLAPRSERPIPPPDPHPSRHVMRGTALVLLGVVSFSSLVGEGAAADWSAVYLREDLGAGAGLAALAFVAFSLGMTACRFVSDRLIARFGPVAVVGAGGLAGAAGLALGVLVPRPVASIAAFAVLGAALAPVVPTAFSAAGNASHADQDAALGWIVTIGYLGSILGPILIGLTAEVASLRWGLAIPAVLGLAICAAAPSVRTAAGGPQGPGSAKA
jgi:MFS family permease